MKSSWPWGTQWPPGGGVLMPPHTSNVTWAGLRHLYRKNSGIPHLTELLCDQPVASPQHSLLGSIWGFAYGYLLQNKKQHPNIN